MDDKKKKLCCDECNGKIIKDFVRNEIYCSNCGLIYEPHHEMGKGLGGLISYLNHKSLNDYIEKIRNIYTIEGLAAARLKVAEIERSKY